MDYLNEKKKMNFDEVVIEIHDVNEYIFFEIK